jgi:hypothetical protein
MTNPCRARSSGIALSRGLWIPGLLLALAACVYGVIVDLADEASTPWISLWPNPLTDLVGTVGVAALLVGMIVGQSAGPRKDGTRTLWLAAWFGSAAIGLFITALALGDEGVYDAGELAGMNVPWGVAALGALTVLPVTVVALVLGLTGLVTLAQDRQASGVVHPGSLSAVASDPASLRAVLARCLWVCGLTSVLINGSWSYFLLDDGYYPSSLNSILNTTGRLTFIAGFALILAALILGWLERPGSVLRSIAAIALAFATAGAALFFLAWLGYAGLGQHHPRATLSEIGGDVFCAAGVVALAAVIGCAASGKQRTPARPASEQSR